MIDPDVISRRKTFLVVFAITVGAVAAICPEYSVARAAVGAVIAGVFAAGVVGVYQETLDWLVDKLAERRARRQALGLRAEAER